MKIKLSKRKIYLVLYFKTFSLIERITVSFSWKNVTLIGAENLRKFDRFSFIPKNVQNLIHHTKIIILILKTDGGSTGSGCSSIQIRVALICCSFDQGHSGAGWVASSEMKKLDLQGSQNTKTIYFICLV